MSCYLQVFMRCGHPRQGLYSADSIPRTYLSSPDIHTPF